MRHSYFNDAQGNKTEVKSEYFSNNTWGVNSWAKYLNSYNNNGILIERITQNWVTQAFVNEKKEVFSNFTTTIKPSVKQAGRGFYLYPNPAGNNLYLRIEDIGSNPFSISIYDTQGKVVTEANLHADSREVKIDVSTLVKGVYLVRIGNESACWSERFMKN